MSEWPKAIVGNHVTQRIEKVTVERGREYNTMGVRWYGNGAYLRPPSRPQTKTLSCARSGDFVFCRIDAQNGPFAVVPDDLDGALVTNEFPLYSVDETTLDPNFLVLCFLQQSTLDKISGLREGRDGRARWKELDFESWKVPLPPVPTQKRIVEAIGALDETITALDIEAQALMTLLRAMRESMLAAAPQVPLASVCSIGAKLVDPRQEEYADLIHIGVDSIEKETGRICGARTAREDGVISGKYLFGVNDVVYSKIRPALRKVALPGFVGLCSADAYPLTPKEGIDPALLHETLLEDRFTRQTTALSSRLKMPKVNRSELFSTIVSMPSEESDRTKITSSLGGLREQFDTLMSESANLRTARAALLDALMNRQIEPAQ